MKSFAKKFLSLALAAVLLLGVFPMAAFAAETEHTVRFYLNDETTCIKEIKVKHGESIPGEKIPETQAPEYAVGGQKGWRYLMGKNYYEGGAITDNTNLVDDYDLREFDVNFYESNGSLISTQKIAGGKAVTSFPTPTKPANGDKFKGWKYKASENTFYNGNAIVDTTNLIAVWTEVVEVPVPEYTVTFYGDDEVTQLDQITVDEGYVLKASDFPTVSKPSNAGNWIGWRYLMSKSNYYDGQPIVDNTNLVADFEELKPAKYFTVTVKGAGVEVTAKEGSKLSATQIDTLKKAVTVPTGKKLDTLRYGDNNVLDTDTVINSNLEVYPYFVNDPNYNPRPDGADWYYTIHLDEGWAHGAKYDAPKQIQQGQRFGIPFVTEKNPNGALPIPSRDYYVFRGWYVVENGYMTNKKVTSETIFDEGRHVTLRAKWEREAEVYLHIYVNNAKDPLVVRVFGYAEDETIYTKDLPIKTYYNNGGKSFEFQGWYDRDGWTLFKAKENPKPITAIQTSSVGGQTILWGHVTDKNAGSNSKPDNTNPKTGDESMIIATTAVMLVSAGALAVFFMDRKRRNG